MACHEGHPHTKHFQTREEDERTPSEPSATGDDPRRVKGRTESRLMDVSNNLGISPPECLRSRYGEDQFFAPILSNPSEFTNFKVEEGLVRFTSEDVEALAIPEITVGG